MKSPDKCPKCNGVFETGYLLERGHHSSPSVTQWIAGLPEKSFWSGLKTDKRANLEVVTFRCLGCGFLESYAR